MSPVERAVLRARVWADVHSLRTAAGLQSFIGEAPERVVNLLGRLVYIACWASRHHGLDDTPEASILAGSANALAELAEQPGKLESYRPTLIACCGAIDRLMPSLSIDALIVGSLELDSLLATGHLGTHDVQRALGRMPTKTQEQTSAQM